MSIRIGVLGASGYTGADLVRLAACHPEIEIKLLTANSHAGKSMASVYPHLQMLDLPMLQTVEEADWGQVDAIFCGLPHGTTQDITKDIASRYPAVKVIDMSADFRLRDVEAYAEWYGHAHRAPELQKQAAYGLTEHNRDVIKDAQIIACPGCYPTAVLTTLLPVVEAGLIDARDIIIDAKSGVSGAGRSLKQNTLFCEVGEGMSPYSVAKHRHAPEIEQEISKVAGQAVTVNFTPHLVPMSRGELVTCYVKLSGDAKTFELRACLESRYKDEPFVHIAPKGMMPATQYVRGSNHVLINVFEDRIKGRAILVGTLDNLVKGSAGQALQNFNLAFGFDEKTGLEQLPLFP
jgi:N-acetyl-gamma-glutamyl-phosphate reductase